MNIFEQNADKEFHFMVDIETLATSSNAAITEIGAVSMHTDAEFHIHTCDNFGDRDPKTVQWRLENNLPWKADVEVAGLSFDLIAFFNWIKNNVEGREPILWCKGTDFDAVILTNAAKRMGIEVPWKYNSIRDVRTLLQFFPQFKVPKDQVTHNALEDAILQKNYLLKIANEIGYSKYHLGAGASNG